VENGSDDKFNKRDEGQAKYADRDTHRKAKESNLLALQKIPPTRNAMLKPNRHPNMTHIPK
jgi:hypothetical protein